MKTFRLSLILCLLCSLTAVGQTEKHNKTYKTPGDVTVDLNASHTKVLVSYWDKNEVKVEAFLKEEGDGKKTKELLDSWKIEVIPQGKELKIVSHAAPAFPGNIHFPPLETPLEAPLAKLPELMMPLQEMIGPLLESISSNPLPPQFYESMGDLNFDYDAYKKDGEKYLEQWEKKVEKNFGKDFEVAMEKWASNFEQDEEKMKAMEAELEKNMEAWGEEFGKEMEKWGEEFGKDMEAWGESFGKQMEAQYGDRKGPVVINSDLSGAGQRLLKITMPKNGNVKLNARHSDVTLSGTTNNLTGRVQHGKFAANTLAGKSTDLKIAYSPVKVKQWNYGILDASYIEDLAIDKAVSIKLKSNSSDVRINELVETGIFHGSFGELSINELDKNFRNVDISLENSELKLDIPDEAAFQIVYNGNRSEIDFPEGLELKSTESYDNHKLRGFNKNRNSEASITIDADFSEVLLK